MLEALNSALSLAGDELPPAERERILQAAELVRAALAGNVVARLKEANEALDKETQHLAALVMQKAMAKI
jgi:hypothetical protein